MDEIKRIIIQTVQTKAVVGLLEWVGTNRITYDGYKIWSRPRGNGKIECYNTKQLIEQYLNENT